MNTEYPNLTDEQVARVRAERGSDENGDWWLNRLNGSAEERWWYFEITREEARLIALGRYESEERGTFGLDPSTGPIVTELTERGLLPDPETATAENPRGFPRRFLEYVAR